MKWQSPGHEFDHEIEHIINKYSNKKIYVYGAGMVGSRTIRSIQAMTDWEISGVIDRDERKSHSKLHGIEVLSLSEFKDQSNAGSSEYIILMGLTDDIGADIRKELISQLQIKQEQCILYDEFMRHDLGILAGWKYNKIFVHSLSLIVSEKCTLKCKKCSILLPYFHDSERYHIEDIKSWIDLAFSKIDYIADFTITGGEPLLHKKLADILSYLCENYRENIGECKIITNGTIKPTEELLDAIEKHHVFVQISDYTKAVPEIKDKVFQTLEALKNRNIPCYFLDQLVWVDFGFGSLKKDTVHSEENLSSFFDYCNTRCRGYVKGKIWYCVNAGFAEKALQRDYDEENQFDLKTVGTSLIERRKIIEFDVGYNHKGYLNMCKECNGTCEINQHYIEVGEQC